jgi:hypothetical protein
MGLLPEDKAALDQMQVDLESLRTFEREVLDILADLGEGNAPTKQALAGEVQDGDFGRDFEEAQFIAQATGATITRIADLADVLHRQVEAMALTVRMAGDSTAAADEANRRRMAKLLRGLGLEPAGSGPVGGDPAAVDPAAAAPAAAADGGPTGPSGSSAATPGAPAVPGTPTGAGTPATPGIRIG